MEPLTIVVLVVALFIGFLMLTSGNRRDRLEQALTELEKERMRLLKSIEHIKISFYQKKLDEKDAQDRIFKFEERLRGIESKILDLKEKPFLRTLKKYETPPRVVGVEESSAEVEKEAKKAERIIMPTMGASAILALFIIIVVGLIAILVLNGANRERIHYGEPIVSMSARVVPTEGTHPGGSAGLRVEVINIHEVDINNVVITAIAPDGSGIRFESGSIGIKTIDVLEKGGSRDVFFPIRVDNKANDGEYVIRAKATNYEGLNSTAETTLMVKTGAKSPEIMLNTNTQ